MYWRNSWKEMYEMIILASAISALIAGIIVIWDNEVIV